MIPDTDRADISMPSFNNSPRILGAPHNELAVESLSTSDFTSGLSFGLPQQAPLDLRRK
jgi:hypothetical protein